MVKNVKKKVTETESRINLEKEYDTKKGIYVLTYNDEPPYKIGMTNGVITKRISSYVNCPSQYDGHWIHMLLIWDIDNDLSAKTVESFIFNRLTRENRVNSTQRAIVNNTEHFNEPLEKIEKVFKEAKEHYKKRAPEMKVRVPKSGDVAFNTKIDGKNITTKKR